MQCAYSACLFLCLTTTLFSQASPADPNAQGKILDTYGKLPLTFEANHGQADGQVKFVSHTGAYTLFLTCDEAVLALNGKTNTTKAKITRTAHSLPSGADEGKAAGVLRMKLRDANPTAKVAGVDALASTTNYFVGNDPKKWRTNVPTYAKVKYEGIYSGIDLVYYGNQRQLEYDFIVAPGANPRRIAFDVRGAKRIRRDAYGDIVFKVDEDEIRWHKPVVYQEKDGARQEIAARYTITGRNRIGFELARYDSTRSLYIDPLVYSTYLGGTGADAGDRIAVDSAGNTYVTGWTCSANFPTLSPLQAVYAGGPPDDCGDAFVSKINPAGSALVYSTFLGGSGADTGLAIAVDTAGNAYVTGWTESSDFPITPGALQPACNSCTMEYSDGDAFVTKIDPTGSSLAYSTYLGGSSYDFGLGIAVDSAGNSYITLAAPLQPISPVTPNVFQPIYSGGDDTTYVTKVNPTGTALVYSTYLGGSGYNEGYGIAVDDAGNAYVTGATSSTDFPVTPGAFQLNCGNLSSCANAFVTKVNPTASALVYSTYLGGSGSDNSASIAIDTAGNAYITGATGSTNFPVTMGAFQTTCKNPKNCRNDTDVFKLTKFNPTGSVLVYSTYLGGNGVDSGEGISVDEEGNAYVTGLTNSRNFPATANAVQKGCNIGHKCAKFDAFVSKMNPAGSVLVYSTYLGGSGTSAGAGVAVDSSNNAYVTGYTCATDFPITPGALQTTYGGSVCDAGDAFVSKLQMLAATTTALGSSPNPSTYGEVVTFTALVSSVIGAPPDGEAVSFMQGRTVLGTGSLIGGSATFTIPTLKVGTHSVKAVYGGDSTFASSTSKALKQVVSKAVEQ